MSTFLCKGIKNLSYPQHGRSFHELSEGLGFVYSLQFTNNGSDKPYFSKTEVDEMITKLKAKGGLYQDNIGAVLKELSEKVAKRFGFTIAEVK
ncbi:DUF4856 domain-containing protein [Tenacibaculum dicentrarchi]|nr:DUF4856 domain-containing protein [Tenacibaculum dicentrarchi]